MKPFMRMSTMTYFESELAIELDVSCDNSPSLLDVDAIGTLETKSAPIQPAHKGLAKVVEELLNDLLLPASASMRPLPIEIDLLVKVHHIQEKLGEHLEHLSLTPSAVFQNLTAMAVVQIHPIAEESAHGADPDFLGPLFQEKLPKPDISVLLVQVEVVRQVHALDWYPFSHAGICQTRVRGTKHFPKQRLRAIDQFREVAIELVVQLVDGVHDALTHLEWEFLSWAIIH